MSPYFTAFLCVSFWHSSVYVSKRHRNKTMTHCALNEILFKMIRPPDVTVFRGLERSEWSIVSDALISRMFGVTWHPVRTGEDGSNPKHDVYTPKETLKCDPGLKPSVQRRSVSETQNKPSVCIVVKRVLRYYLLYLNKQRIFVS